MGSLFQGTETKTGFQLRLIKKMGYDIGCIGNHEFDYGPEKLAEIINSSVKGGEIPPLLLGNAVFDPKDPGLHDEVRPSPRFRVQAHQQSQPRILAPEKDPASGHRRRGINGRAELDAPLHILGRLQFDPAGGGVLLARNK